MNMGASQDMNNGGGANQQQVNLSPNNLLTISIELVKLKRWPRKEATIRIEDKKQN